MAPTFIQALTVDSQGRLLVAGSAAAPYPYGEEVGVWRFLASGAVDTSFGTSGQASFFDGANDYAGGCVDASGNVLVAGYTYMANAELWRFTPAGAVDTTFGNNGEAYPPDDGAGADYAIACTAAGTLLAGRADPFGTTVWRYTLAGALDTAGFAAPNGYVQAPPGAYGNYTAARAMAIDGNGDIMLVGSVYSSTNTVDFGTGLWRLSGSGALDAGLDGSALVVPSLQFDAGGVDAGGFTWSDATGVAIDASGNIVLSTYAGVARLTSTGLLDTTFAGGLGYIALPAPAAAGAGSSVDVFGIAIDGEGRIVAVGAATPGTTNSFMAVWRLTSAGALDTTFGTGGSFATRGTGMIAAVAKAVFVDSSNRPYVGGTGTLPSELNVPVVWRLTP